MREGEELKTPRHASAAATRNDRLPHSRHLGLIISRNGIKIDPKKVAAIINWKSPSNI